MFLYYTVLVIIVGSCTASVQAADKIVQFERHLLKLAQDSDPCDRIINTLARYQRELSTTKDYSWDAAIKGNVMALQKDLQPIFDNLKDISCATDSEKIIHAFQVYYQSVYEAFVTRIAGLTGSTQPNVIGTRKNILLQTYEEMHNFIGKLGKFKSVLASLFVQREQLLKQWLETLGSEFKGKSMAINNVSDINQWNKWYDAGVPDIDDFAFTEAERQIIVTANRKRYEKMLQLIDEGLKDKKYNDEELQRAVLSSIANAIEAGNKSSHEVWLRAIKYFLSQALESANIGCMRVVQVVRDNLMRLSNIIDLPEDALVNEVAAFVPKMVAQESTHKDCLNATRQLVDAVKNLAPHKAKELDQLLKLPAPSA